jgi:hypothetical protein
MSVVLRDDGSVAEARAHDNRDLVSFPIVLGVAPQFVLERIALMKLTDLDEHKRGVTIGVKLSAHEFLIYLTKDEYKTLEGVRNEKESNRP